MKSVLGVLSALLGLALFVTITGNNQLSVNFSTGKTDSQATEVSEVDEPEAIEETVPEEKEVAVEPAAKPETPSSPNQYKVLPAILLQPGAIKVQGDLPAYEVKTYKIEANEGDTLQYVAKGPVTLYKGQQVVTRDSNVSRSLDKGTYFIQAASPTSNSFSVSGYFSRPISYDHLIASDKVISRTTHINFAKGSSGQSQTLYLTGREIRSFTFRALEGQTMKINLSTGAALYLLDKTGKLVMSAVVAKDVVLPGGGRYEILIALLPGVAPHNVKFSLEIE